MSLGTESLIVECFYRPPEKNILICVDNIDSILNFMPKYGKIIILSDMNINHFKL